MRFATLASEAGFRLGLGTARGVLDVARAAERFGTRVPTTIAAVLEHGVAELAALVERTLAAEASDGLFVREDRAGFGPCVTHPEKVLCVGLNYRKHAAETGHPIPECPVLFSKFNSALAGHGAVINVSSQEAQQFDYEVELVIVIGRVARDVAEHEALDYVFGYCTGNDVSARDLQRRTSQWLLGKSLDGFAPIGPFLVTADEVRDPGALGIECRVNGELRQSSTTADMVFGCASLVSYISRYFTLKPGDLIFTGTPEGVILGYPEPQRVWLKAGDEVRSRIDTLGELAFRLA